MTIGIVTYKAFLTRQCLRNEAHEILVMIFMTINDTSLMFTQPGPLVHESKHFIFTQPTQQTLCFHPARSTTTRASSPSCTCSPSSSSSMSSAVSNLNLCLCFLHDFPSSSTVINTDTFYQLQICCTSPRVVAVRQNLPHISRWNWSPFVFLFVFVFVFVYVFLFVKNFHSNLVPNVNFPYSSICI